MEELCVEELCYGRIVLWKNCAWKNCVWKNCAWKNCGTPTLILDGWTNVTRHSVINFVVSTTTGPVFYKNIETGLNIFNLVRTVIEEIGKEKCLPL